MDKGQKSAVQFNLLSMIITVSLQLITLAIAAKYVPSDEFGRYGLYLAIYNVFIFIADFGLPTSILKIGWANFRQLNFLIFVNICVGMFFSLIIYILIPMIGSYYADPFLAELVMLIIPVLLFTIIGRTITAVFQHLLHLEIISKIDFLAKLISSCFTLCYMYLNHSIYGFIYGQLISAILLLIPLILLYLKLINFRLSLDHRGVKKHLTFGLLRLSETSTNQIAQNIDVFIIGKFFGLEILGIYALVKQIVLKPLQLINPIFLKVYLPVMCSMKIINEVFNKYAELLSLISLITSLGLMLSILLVGSNTLPLANIVTSELFLFYSIMAVYGVLRSLSSPIGSLYISLNKNTKGIFLNLFVCILLSTTLAIVGCYYKSLIILGFTILTCQLVILLIQLWFITDSTVENKQIFFNILKEMSTFPLMVFFLMFLANIAYIYYHFVSFSHVSAMLNSLAFIVVATGILFKSRPIALKKLIKIIKVKV